MDIALEVRPFLRQFSVTDGLIRGTTLVSYVVVTAAFALLPGFGVHGLMISNAIQDLISGFVEMPFGWIADRFGWAKSVIVSYGLKFFVTVIILFAVIAAYLEVRSWCWIFITLEAIVDAFVISLQNGAYEAAYSEWYKIKVRDKLGSPTETPPPLFIRSLRYSMWIRLLIPVSIVALIIVLQITPIGGGGFTSYTATFVALAFILVLRLVVFVRIYRDLKPVMYEENLRISKNSAPPPMKVLVGVLEPIKSNLSAFILYSVACFQYSLSCVCIAGMGMQQMNKMSFKQPYGWLAGVGMTLLVYVIDSFFWLSIGYRLTKMNAVFWIRNLGIFLLGMCLVTAALFSVEAHPALQAFGFASCTLAGTLCAGAIKRFFASHVREWLNSPFVATWFSVAESLGLIGLGVTSAFVVYADRVVPTAAMLLVVSVLVAIGIIYYLSTSILIPVNQVATLKTTLSKTILSVAILASAITGAASVYYSVSSLVAQQKKTEQQYVKNIERAYSKHETDIARSEFSGFGKVVCISSDCSSLNKKPMLAAKTYYLNVLGADSHLVHLEIEFDRTDLVLAAAKPLLITVFLFLICVLVLHRLLLLLTKRIQQEITLIFSSSRGGENIGRKSFAISEFKELALRIASAEKMKEELNSHRLIADISFRVAHDIRSPLTVFEMVLPDLYLLPEQTRIAVRRAICRIGEVSDDLLQVGRTLRSSTFSIEQETSTNSNNENCFITSLVSEVVSEKRICFRYRRNLSIFVNHCPSAYDAFVLAERSFLKSALSNVIQNSAEAIADSGEITVSLKADDLGASIIVEDNGCGIPNAILPTLMSERRTFGKPNGNGLALFHAKKVVEKWGGAIGIDSKEGLGTRVHLRLSRVPPPNWFVSKLVIDPEGVICVLDDDESIHTLWESRLSFIRQTHSKITLVCFSKSADLLRWIDGNSSRQGRILLIDQDLVGENTNGLEIIEAVRHSGICFLVTSYSDEPKIIQACLEQNIRLMPKSLIANVPIEVSRKLNPNEPAISRNKKLAE